MTAPVSVSAALPALLSRLSARGWPLLSVDALADFARQHGEVVAFCVDDPTKLPEVADAAVILPELLKDSGLPLTPCVVDPGGNAELQARYGVMKYPAFLFLRDGGYVGVMAGLRSWGEYLHEVHEMRARPVGRAPSIGIKVTGPNAGGCA